MTYEIVKAIAEQAAERKIAESKIPLEVQTTDATATVLISITAGIFERGVIECTINGVKDDGIIGISATQIFSYKTDDTTLTVHSSASLYSQSDFTTAAVSQNANGFVVEIKVTGEAATVINWSGTWKQTKMNVEVAL